MRATRRERYSPFSGCRTTLYCWDGIGLEFLEGVSPKAGNRTRTFRGRDICKEPEQYISDHDGKGHFAHRMLWNLSFATFLMASP